MSIEQILAQGIHRCVSERGESMTIILTLEQAKYLHELVDEFAEDPHHG